MLMFARPEKLGKKLILNKTEKTFSPSCQTNLLEKWLGKEGSNETKKVSNGWSKETEKNMGKWRKQGDKKFCQEARRGVSRPVVEYVRQLKISKILQIGYFVIFFFAYLNLNYSKNTICATIPVVRLHWLDLFQLLSYCFEIIAVYLNTVDSITQLLHRVLKRKRVLQTID